jgi:hypothetical protein
MWSHDHLYNQLSWMNTLTISLLWKGFIITHNDVSSVACQDTCIQQFESFSFEVESTSLILRLFLWDIKVKMWLGLVSILQMVVGSIHL